MTVALLLTIVSVCLFGDVLNSPSGIFSELRAAWLSADWMLLVCLALWCGTFIFLMFSLSDLPLIGLLFIAIGAFFIGYSTSQPAVDALILLMGVTLGKGVEFFLKRRKQKAQSGNNIPEVVNHKSAIVNFLVGLVGLLAFGSWWHLEIAHNFYPGTRWTGLWNNPNVYGMLMSAGVVLTIGLLVAKRKADGRGGYLRFSNVKQASSLSASMNLRRLFFHACTDKLRWTCETPVPRTILFIAAFMMAVGLMFSYSRGAWVGTAVGLLYLAKAYGKLEWLFVLPGFIIVAAIAWFFWSSTPDNAPWYLKRLDFGRPSAQHRVAAWRGAVQMMLDHPLGVGWKKTVQTYQNDYSPPENGAAAITTNDYLMLGTQLGFPGLICFVAYVAVCFTGVGQPYRLPSEARQREYEKGLTSAWAGQTPALLYACRAGALALAVEFWFDGGLFTIETATVFWILLEFGKKMPPCTPIKHGEEET